MQVMVLSCCNYFKKLLSENTLPDAQNLPLNARLSFMVEIVHQCYNRILIVYSVISFLLDICSGQAMFPLKFLMHNFHVISGPVT